MAAQSAGSGANSQLFGMSGSSRSKPSPSSAEGSGPNEPCLLALDLERPCEHAQLFAVSASGSQRPLVIGTRSASCAAASRKADRSVRTLGPDRSSRCTAPTPALIRRIATAEAAEIVSRVWAYLVFPGFPSRNTSRLNRNLGIRNDRVSDARASFGCRALLFRIRGSVLDVEQVSESSYLRVSARE
jgi:hypothetical protein